MHCFPPFYFDARELFASRALIIGNLNLGFGFGGLHGRPLLRLFRSFLIVFGTTAAGMVCRRRHVNVNFFFFVVGIGIGG